MSLTVAVEDIHPSEALAAYRTVEGALVGVGEEVAAQMLDAAKRFLADVAAVAGGSGRRRIAEAVVQHGASGEASLDLDARHEAGDRVKLNR